MAMDSVSRRRMTSAIPALLTAAESPDAKIRTSAVKKLGEVGGPTELPALLDLLAKAKSAEDLEATEQAVSAVCLKAADPADCAAKVEGRMPPRPARPEVRAGSCACGGWRPNALKAVRERCRKRLQHGGSRGCYPCPAAGMAGMQPRTCWQLPK